MSNPTKQSLYQRIFTQTKEAALKAKAVILMSGDKQRFMSAAINKSGEIADLTTELGELREVVKEGKPLDVEKIVNKRIKITRAQEALNEIEAEYKELFGKALVIPE